MQNPRIIFSSVADFASCGGETLYNKNIPVEAYIQRFEKETNKMVCRTNAVVLSLKVTVHDKDGNFKRDKNGKRIERFIYPLPSKS